MSCKKLNQDSELNDMIAKQSVRMQQSMLNQQRMQSELEANGIHLAFGITKIFLISMIVLPVIKSV